MKSSHTRYHKFSRIMRYSLVWGWWELRCCREVELGFKLIWQLAELNWKGLPKLNSRVRWFGPSEQKTHKIKTGHTYSCVKLNFRVDLFSCIFLWSENGHFCQKCPFSRLKKWHFEEPNQNSKTTFIVQTFPKYGPYDFYFMNLSLLGAILAIFQFCRFSGLFWPFFPCKKGWI